MPWPVLLLIIIVSLMALTAALMLLTVTVYASLVLDRQLTVQLHIRLYKINIRTLEFKSFSGQKPSQKKQKKKGRLPSLKFIATSLNLYGAVGLMDAKNTALAAGGFYGLLGALQAAVGHFTSLKSCRMRVDPVYSGNRLYLEANCIARAKAGNIILAYIRYLISKKI